MKAGEVSGERPLFGGKWRERSLVRSLSGAYNALSHWILSGTNELLSTGFRETEVALQLQHGIISRALWHHCCKSYCILLVLGYKDIDSSSAPRYVKNGDMLRRERTCIAKPCQKYVVVCSGVKIQFSRPVDR